MTTFDSLKHEQLRAIREQLTPVLEAVSERIHYAESRRTNFSVIAGVMIAGGLALLTLALGAADSMIVRDAIAAASASVIALGALILLLYSRQTNRYPWTRATKTWKWFYRDALPKQAAFDFPWSSYLRFGREKDRIEQEYGDQLPQFKTRLTQLVDERVSLEQDAEQLYALHVNEKYKNLYLNHLRRLTIVGLEMTALIVIAAAVAGWRADTADERIHAIVYSSPSVRVTAKWRELKPPDSPRPTELLLAVEVTNLSAAPVSLPVWKVTDRHGWAIPADSVTNSYTLMSIPRKTSARYAVLLRVTGADPVGAVAADIP